MTVDASESTASPSLERVAQGLQALSESLRRAEHDPDDRRGDWKRHRESLDQLESLVDDQLLPSFGAAVAELEDEDAVARLHSAVVELLGDAAALSIAAGRRRRGLELLRRASTLGRGSKEAMLCTAAIADPERFVRLARAWWLFGQERRDEARAAAKAVLPGAPASIAESARAILDAPIPVKHAPEMATVNGFGVSIYGDRDRHPNGTYVKTRFITALFVPVFPLDAYRVADGESRGWYFLAKVPLSPLCVWWRKLLTAGLVVLLLGWGVSSYFDSTSYRMGRAIAAAEQAEQDAGPEERTAVIDQYEAVLNDFPEGDPEQLRPVLEAFVRLSAEDVTTPLTVEHLGDARRVLRRYQSLPSVARRSTHISPMVTMVERWANELGTEEQAQILGGMELLGQAIVLAESDPGITGELVRRRQGLGRELAARLAPEWPLEAIRQYVSVGYDPEAVIAAAVLIDLLGEGPSVWLELGPTVEVWASSAVRNAELLETVKRARARLAAARERNEDPERQALLAGNDEDALAAAVAASPGDQELAVALAYLRQSHGDDEGALAVLTALGSPGRMVMGAQVALASILVATKRHAEADALLERVLSNRLPAFETARRSFVERSDLLTERYIAQAEKGMLPAGISGRLGRASESDQMRIFGEWLDEQLAADVELSRLREDYVALTGVIDVAIQWGTIKLRRAQGTTGSERQAFLDGAERAFLAIASDGQGVPSYHLGLGQVYYRMGREDEGERELGNLLDDDPPEVRLAVARTYRDLGMIGRAREVATDVFEQSEDRVKKSAASFMALASTELDERRTWLLRAGDDPRVKLDLIELDADELRHRGELLAADEKYAQVVEGLTKTAETSPSAANNAAVALSARYECTGDMARLHEAVALLERSRSLQPDSAVVLGNLASAHESVATTELLARWVRPRQLLLHGSEQQNLLLALSQGPVGAKVRAALAESPSLRRTIELSHQEQVLAPRRIDAHQRLLRWYRWLRDDEQLARLAEVVGAATLDESREAEGMQRYLDGEYDADRLQALERRLQHFESRRETVERRGHRPTVAAFHFSRGELLLQRAFLAKNVDDARAASEAHAQAHAQWPELGARQFQARALALVALLEASESSVSLRQALDDHHRLLGTMALLAWLLEDGGDALAALRRRPELAEAVMLRRDEMPEALSLFDWILAQVADDEALLAASHPAIERSGVRDRLTVDARLSPRSESSEALLRHLD